MMKPLNSLRLRNVVCVLLWFALAFPALAGAPPAAGQQPTDPNSLYVSLPGEVADGGLHCLELTAHMAAAVVFTEQAIVFSAKQDQCAVAEIMTAMAGLRQYLAKNATSIGKALCFDLFVDGSLYHSFNLDGLLRESGRLKSNLPGNVVGQYFLPATSYPLPAELQKSPLVAGLAAVGSCPCAPHDASYCGDREFCLAECNNDPASLCYKACMNDVAACLKGYTVASRWTETVLLGYYFLYEKCVFGKERYYYERVTQKKYWEDRRCYTGGNSCITLVRVDPAEHILEEIQSNISCDDE